MTSNSTLQQWLLDRRGRLVEADRRRPWRHDLAVILFLLLVTVPNSFDGWNGPEGYQNPVALVLGSIVLVAPLWWRRRAPVAAFAGVTAVLLTEWLLGLVVPSTLALLVALCSVATRSSWRALSWVSGATMSLGIAAIGTLIPDASWDVQVIVLFLVLGTATAAVAIGLTLRTRAAYLRALEDRAVRLETQRDQRARLATAAERARIAREMHDIIGHHVSIIVGLADGGAALASSRHETSEEPLRLIGDTGRQALGELRRVLGVLKEGPEQQLSPQPDLGELDRLLDGVRAAGLSVTCRTAGDLHHLGSGLQLAVYRIVQEALTNTLKHADAASAEVSVEAAVDGEVRVRVRDHGSGGPRQPAAESATQQGVLGIRERAALYGGTVTAGPADDDGWLVDVVLKEPV